MSLLYVPRGCPGPTCLHAAEKLGGGGLKSLVSHPFLRPLLFRDNFITWFYSLASQWRNISWFTGFREEVLILLKAKLLQNFTSTFLFLLDCVVLLYTFKQVISLFFFLWKKRERNVSIVTRYSLCRASVLCFLKILFPSQPSFPPAT